MSFDFSKIKIYFNSLGCEKNLVDSQVMLGKLKMEGSEFITSPEEADVIIVNTCAFIGDAKKESIDTILELSDFKVDNGGKCQALVVAGCLAQRYAQNLEAEMPEVDLIIGTGEYHKIALLLKAYGEGKLAQKSFVEIPKYIHSEFDPRLNTSPSYMAWLKISEGCNRNCTFCIIPTLRGRLRSRSVESLVAETQQLVANGAREVNLISQDLSKYGVDLKLNNPLLDLLSGLEKIAGLRWIRLFYFYPDDLSDEVIEKIANSQKICHYLDMPVQHFSDSVLKRMNRQITGNEILAKIKKLRQRIPQMVIRTSIIVGFPGESEEDFALLLKGVEEAQFDHLGVFKYSDEEDTPAFKLTPKVSSKLIHQRFEQIYQLQKQIVANKHQSMVGETLEVLVEGLHEETELLIKARHRGQAPDIDGNVFLNDLNGQQLQVGDFAQVLVTEVSDYDLIATVVKKV